MLNLRDPKILRQHNLSGFTTTRTSLFTIPDVEFSNRMVSFDKPDDVLAENDDHDHELGWGSRCGGMLDGLMRTGRYLENFPDLRTTGRST
ncbi:hypothetical protein OBBRIDRAFT_177222 [Obba rivulosa]|uniref:Uncharacterized protein n=1 Tax=Obba rivulosa TaxID=1052685 RepID=A0A8E2ASG2_9APHY|nr:hypothetical protein OBBRIDRAFT_177222 [Obba rivulosa]